MASREDMQLDHYTPGRGTTRAPQREAGKGGGNSATTRGQRDPPPIQRSVDARDLLTQKAKTKEVAVALQRARRQKAPEGTSRKYREETPERIPNVWEDDAEVRALEVYADYAKKMYEANLALLAKGKPAMELIPPPSKAAVTRTQNTRVRTRLVIVEESVQSPEKKGRKRDHESVYSPGQGDRSKGPERSEDRGSVLNRLGARERIPVRDRLGLERRGRSGVPRLEEVDDRDARHIIRKRKSEHQSKSYVPAEPNHQRSAPDTITVARRAEEEERVERRKRGSQKAEQRELRKPVKFEEKDFIPLNTKPSTILHEVHDQLPKPRPMKASASMRDNSKHCDFHEDHGHTTDECITLRKIIDRMIKSGSLEKYKKHPGQSIGYRPARGTSDS